MPTGRPLSPPMLSESERVQLSEWTRRPKTAQALVLRARIVLLSAEGHSNTVVARRLYISLPTAGKWRRRFLERRLDGLLDEPRPGTRTQTERCRGRAVLARTVESATAGCHALVDPLYGQGHRTESEQHQPHLARLFLQPHRSEDLQA